MQRHARWHIHGLKAFLDAVTATRDDLHLGITKGRDFSWQGAVDGLRINDTVYDFEETGVFETDPAEHRCYHEGPPRAAPRRGPAMPLLRHRQRRPGDLWHRRAGRRLEYRQFLWRRREYAAGRVVERLGGRGVGLLDYQR